MKVLHLSVSDWSGGAGRAAHRIDCGLKEVGVDSHMLVQNKATEDPTVREWPSNGPLAGRFLRRLKDEFIKSALTRYNRPSGFESFTDSRAATGTALANALAEFDLINLHFTSRFVDWRLLGHPVIAQKPVVITLHDTNAFTGGCHYTSGCDRFLNACGSCPQLGSKTEHDLSRRNWTRKRDALRKRRAATGVVGSSEWITQEAKRSSLLGGLHVVPIHYGIDTQVFQPADKEAARRVLRIPTDARVVMFSAARVSSPRKGFLYLAEAMKHLSSAANIVLLSVGAGAPSLNGAVRHLDLGPVNNDRLLSAVYSAADVFVIPSLEENFALAALEAAACGLPVIGFATG